MWCKGISKRHVPPQKNWLVKGNFCRQWRWFSCCYFWWRVGWLFASKFHGLEHKSHPLRIPWKTPRVLIFDSLELLDLQTFSVQNGCKTWKWNSPIWKEYFLLETSHLLTEPMMGGRVTNHFFFNHPEYTAFWAFLHPPFFLWKPILVKQ